MSSQFQSNSFFEESAPGGGAEANASLSPREAKDYIGHARTEEELLPLIDSGKIPHALVFSGIKGIGKSTIAFHLARHLFSKDVIQENRRRRCSFFKCLKTPP